MNPEDKRRLVWVVVALAVALGWFFRFQPLPTAGVGAVQNRWTGAIYFVNGERQLEEAKPQK